MKWPITGTWNGKFPNPILLLRHEIATFQASASKIKAIAKVHFASFKRVMLRNNHSA